MTSRDSETKPSSWGRGNDEEPHASPRTLLGLGHFTDKILLTAGLLALLALIVAAAAALWLRARIRSGAQGSLQLKAIRGYHGLIKRHAAWLDGRVAHKSPATPTSAAQ